MNAELGMLLAATAAITLCSAALAAGAERRLPGRPAKVAAICSGMGREGQYDARLELALDHLETAGKSGADIACLPEDFVGKKAEPVPGPTTNAVAELARKHGMYVICPLREQAGAERYNTAVLLDRRGKIAGRYRKVFPFFGEGSVPSREGVQVVETDVGRVGILTCFDSNFAELWNEADIQGAELVFWVSGGGGGVWLNAYATLHNYYAVAVGGGQVVDCTGKDIKKVERPRRGQVLATLDLDRTFVHGNFNEAKIKRLLADHQGEAEVERRYRVENWYLLRAVKPGVRVRDLCTRYGIETLRAYRTRSRQTIHKARKAKKEI